MDSCLPSAPPTFRADITNQIQHVLLLGLTQPEAHSQHTDMRGSLSICEPGWGAAQGQNACLGHTRPWV
jgi:hypothetical protein